MKVKRNILRIKYKCIFEWIKSGVSIKGSRLLKKNYNNLKLWFISFFIF